MLTHTVQVQDFTHYLEADPRSVVEAREGYVVGRRVEEDDTEPTWGRYQCFSVKLVKNVQGNCQGKFAKICFLDFVHIFKFWWSPIGQRLVKCDT
jgi:hypothetical protein